tara:strand:- start:125034 stop:128135 length:3102 start_codon:yes stop_codon:yes gene_type:complete
VEHRLAILRFLGAVAQRLRRRAAYQGILYLLAFLGALALLAPLLAHWAKLDVRTAWVVAALATTSLLICYLIAFLGPRKRWSTASAQARYVGQREGALRSDLLSSVEFLDEAASSGSPELREALLMSTAQRIEPLRLQALVPFATIRRPLAAAGTVVALYACAALLAPTALVQGWQQLLRKPAKAPFNGARLAEAPLVGDVDIVVVFPEYTGMANLSLPSSSGDFEAMAGSTIKIVTQTTGVVEKASILLAETDELASDEEVLLTKSYSESATKGPSSKGVALSGSFRLMKETYYRFQIERGANRQVEARARHITVVKDEAPKIELYAPADELDVAKLKRVELAYVASDDFGIRTVELVYTPQGGKESRQPLEVLGPRPALVSGPGSEQGPSRTAAASASPALGMAPRNAQHKYLWDLSVLPLRPGVQIEYHLEVSDNDDVQGPNIGRSRSYSLRLFSPRERHEELIARQQQLAENMLGLLADRLMSPGTSVATHRAIQRGADEIVIEIGGLVAALKEDELATKKLREALANIRERMSERVLREGALLASFEKRDEDEDNTKALEASDAKIIAELEDDVLLLSDWLSRQQLENALSISDEAAASRERLKKLFEEYERTGSQEVLSEIERELKTLERKLAEIAEANASLPPDVLDQFVNSEALQGDQEKGCLEQVRDFLKAGKAKEAQEQMQKCSEDMDKGDQFLEDSLSQLRGENFSEEEKQLDDMLNDLADLAQDQDEIADQASEIYKRYSDAVSELQQGKSAEAKNTAGETLEKLRKSVKKIPKSGLTPFTREEMTVLEKRLEDTQTMLERGELAEALSMAKYAKESLKTIRDELEFSLDEAWSRKGVAAEKQARTAYPLAKKLVEQLQAVTPSPSEIMSSEDRRKLEKLRQRQKASNSRTGKLLKKAQGQAESMPGKSGKAVESGLEAALEHMKQAEDQMRSRDPSGAKQQASEASGQLRAAQESARGAARQRQKHGQQGWRDEPVRIPGAEDYRAPEKFREEILDAMQDESAPSGFSEQVKQYYKDIIQ